MGLIQSPRVATDGLVFYYDQNNPKSYEGPAIQNLAATLAFNNTTGTGVSIAGGLEPVANRFILDENSVLKLVLSKNIKVLPVLPSAILTFLDVLLKANWIESVSEPTSAIK